MWVVGFLLIAVGLFIAWYDNPVYQFISHNWQSLDAFMMLCGFGALVVKSIMFFIDYAKRK